MIDDLEQLIELFHASPTTGDPDRRGIYPFRARANPHISRGEGQGRGFYAWPNMKDALDFARNTILTEGNYIREPARGANVFQTRVPAKHLTPDAELAFDVLRPLLEQNAEEVNRALRIFKQMTGSDVYMGNYNRRKTTTRLRRISKPAMAISGFEVADKPGQSWELGDLLALVGSPKAAITPPARIALGPDTGSASILGPILRALRLSSPSLSRLLLSETIAKRRPVRSRVASPLKLVATLGKP
jgi:hypothetical protein